MKIGEHIRQGDTLLRKIKEIPADARKMKRDKNGAIVLAYGEKSGHMHRFTEKRLCSFTTLDNNELEYVLVGGSGATLKHELVNGKKAEHNPIKIDDGAYEAAQQVEYTPSEIIRVAD